MDRRSTQRATPKRKKVRVKENAIGTAGLLKTIRLPLGGTTELEYDLVRGSVEMPGSRYVLSRVTQSDGLAEEGSVHQYGVNFEYAGGYYDRTERESYGFAKVRTIAADGSFTETEYLNREWQSEGVPVSEKFYGVDGRLYTETENSYTPRTSYGLNRKESVFLGMTETVSRYFGSGPENYTETRQKFGYDSFGNINLMEDEGSTFTEADDYQLEVEYAYLPGYRNGYPSEMRVFDAEGTLLRKRLGIYDGRGNLTELRHFVTEKEYSSFYYTYDAYGNALTAESPGGVMTAYDYDDALHQFVGEISLYNKNDPGYRYSSAMEWDYTLGVDTAGIDVNGNRQVKEYDSFGRMTVLRTPYDTGALGAVSFEYHTEGFPWYSVTKNKLRFDPGDAEVMETLTFVDGLGRTILTAKEGETGFGSDRKTGWNVSGKAVYDEKARVTAQGQAVFVEVDEIQSKPELFDVWKSREILRPTMMGYDSLDRTVKTTLPDGSEMNAEFDEEEGKILTRAIDPLGNVTEEVKGLRKELLELRKKDGDGDGVLLTSSSYVYSPLGQLLEALDHQGNPVRYAYDFAGRRTEVESPSGGRVNFFYDEAGRLVRKTDSKMRARGQSIKYEYDALGRLVKTLDIKMQIKSHDGVL